MLRKLCRLYFFTRFELVDMLMPHAFIGVTTDSAQAHRLRDEVERRLEAERER